MAYCSTRSLADAAHVPFYRHNPGSDADYDLRQNGISSSWPNRGQCFNPQVMSPTKAISLIEGDGLFLLGGERPLLRTNSMAFESNGSKVMSVTHPSMIESLLRPQFGIIFVPQQRMYFKTGETKCKIGLSCDFWRALLETCSIPPNAIELLHDNNGGYWQHVSHGADNPQSKCEASGQPHYGCAYHICIKLCHWGSEHFIYARHDLHTQKNLIIVMGTAPDVELGNLQRHFMDGTPTHLFTMLLVLIGLWANEVETNRWLVDFDVQAVELETGYGLLEERDNQPLPPERMKLRKSIAKTQLRLRSILRSSEQLHDIFGFFDQSLSRFEQLHDTSAEDATCRRHLHQQLRDVIIQRQSQQIAQAAQINGLIYRIDAQWNVIAT